jgi:hypothetical protein
MSRARTARTRVRLVALPPVATQAGTGKVCNSVRRQQRSTNRLRKAHSSVARGEERRFPAHTTAVRTTAHYPLATWWCPGGTTGTME